VRRFKHPAAGRRTTGSNRHEIGLFHFEGAIHFLDAAVGDGLHFLLAAPRVVLGDFLLPKQLANVGNGVATNVADGDAGPLRLLPGLARLSRRSKLPKPDSFTGSFRSKLRASSSKKVSTSSFASRLLMPNSSNSLSANCAFVSVPKMLGLPRNQALFGRGHPSNRLQEPCPWTKA